MGYSLTVLVLTDWQEVKNGDQVVPEGQLHLARSSGICCQLRDFGEKKPIVEPRPLPKDMRVLVSKEDSVDYEENDVYGDKLTYVFAKDLKNLDMTADRVTPFELAAKAYIDALPELTPIVLYWD